MPAINAKLVGVELYFDHLEAAREFYGEVLGLNISSEKSGHHVQFEAGLAFLCAEKRGVENYPSQDKVVVFLEVTNLDDAIAAVGRDRVVHLDLGSPAGHRPWAVLHDPEGHNVLLIQSRQETESGAEPS